MGDRELTRGEYRADIGGRSVRLTVSFRGPEARIQIDGTVAQQYSPWQVRDQSDEMGLQAEHKGRDPSVARTKLVEASHIQHTG